MRENKKEQKKKPIEEAAERLAEILCMQIELNRKNRRRKKYGKEKI